MSLESWQSQLSNDTKLVKIRKLSNDTKIAKIRPLKIHFMASFWFENPIDGDKFVLPFIHAAYSPFLHFSSYACYNAVIY